MLCDVLCDPKQRATPYHLAFSKQDAIKKIQLSFIDLGHEGVGGEVRKGNGMEKQGKGKPYWAIVYG